MNAVGNEIQGWSYQPVIVRLSGLITSLVLIYLLWNGWAIKPMSYLTAEHGAGYWLGIIGGSMMLMLGLYPMRKNIAFMNKFGAIRHWFRVHMFMGLFAPVLILYHCNFSFGAVNSNVALLSMLIVAGSGIIGRYFYKHIHKGLYGREISLDEMRKHWIQVSTDLDKGLFIESINTFFTSYESHIRVYDKNFLKAFFLFIVSPVKSYQLRRLLKKADLKKSNKAVYSLLLSRLSAARAVYRHMLFERFFATWHLLHMPLFMMLIVSGVFHVVAVHMY